MRLRNLSEWGSFYWVVPVVFVSILSVWIIEKKKHKKQVLIGMLISWFLALTYLMFIYRLPGRRGSTLKLNAFHMFMEAEDYRGPITTNQALRQIMFNAMLYVPFGAIVFSLSRRAWLTIFSGVVLSILTEALQFVMELGWADIDDIISNTIGLLVGTFLYSVLLRKISDRAV